MSSSSPSGAALAELLVALLLISGLAVLSAPLVVRNGLLRIQGQVLLDGTEAAAGRAARFQVPGSTGCLAGAGQDSSRLTRIDWVARRVGTLLALELVIQDHALRLPPETLATVVRCRP